MERVNRTINTAIRSYVKQDQRLWDTKLPEIELMLNTTIHSATGFTPYFITHGHELSERGSDYQLMRHNENLTEEEKESRRKEMFTKMYEIVRRNLEKASESSRHNYNLRSRKFAKSFQVGQLVYRKNMKQSNAIEHYNSKYGPQYLPCRIRATKGSSSYELEDLDGKNLGVWPAVHLKPG